MVGPVTMDNSLFGTSVGDRAGGTITVLPSSNFVAQTPGWDNAAGASVGAVTFVDGTKGLIGPITEQNSLVGTTAGRGVGGKVTVLANGNYVVNSLNWGNAS